TAQVAAAPPPVATPPAPAAAPAGFAPAPLYAELFADLRSFPFAGEAETIEGSGKREKKQTKKVSFSCHVKRGTTGPGFMTSELTCEGAGQELSMRLAATATGLYQLSEPLVDVAAIEGARLVIAAAPVVGTTSLQNDDEGTVERVVTPDGDGFCSEERGTIGDSFSQTLCLSGGTPTRLETHFEGGMSKRLTVRNASARGTASAAPGDTVEPDCVELCMREPGKTTEDCTSDCGIEDGEVEAAEAAAAQRKRRRK
ncbi:MAG: hypothetical protein M3680_31555, partial [Myxococcota bacterium]|nr:hypothetical protein [Myxococcota bacterium]